MTDQTARAHERPLTPVHTGSGLRQRLPATSALIGAKGLPASRGEPR